MTKKYAVSIKSIVKYKVEYKIQVFKEIDLIHLNYIFLSTFSFVSRIKKGKQRERSGKTLQLPFRAQIRGIIY